MNLFEQATKDKFRFTTGKGELNVEQLWDLPLTSRREGEIDLDKIARLVNQALKDATEESFVATVANPTKTILAAKLEVVKHIIAYKIDAAEKAKKLAETQAQRSALREVLHRKKGQELDALSIEEIERRLGDTA